MAEFSTNKRLADTGALNVLDLSTGPHTLTYRKGTKQQLIVINGESAAQVDVTLAGQGVGTVDIPEVGDTDLSAGRTFAVAAGEIRYINLDSYGLLLGASGNTVDVTISGATSGNSFGGLIEA